MPRHGKRANSGISRRTVVKGTAVGAAAGLAGCLGGGNGEGDEELSWMTFPQSDEFAEFFDQRNREFEEEYDVPVDDEVLSVEDYKTQIGNYLGTDQAPDVFVMWNGPGRIGDFVVTEEVVPVTEVVSDDFLSQYEDGLDVWKYTDQDLRTWTEDGGDIYGIPNYISGAPLWYNKNVLEEAGINPDDLQHRRDITWDEFVDVLETVRDETDHTPLSLGNEAGGHWAYMLTGLWIKLVGADAYLDAALGRDGTDFTDDLMVEAGHRCQELYEADLINDDDLSLSEDEAESRFFQNEAAFITDGIWVRGLYNEYADPDELGPIGEGWDYMWYPTFPDEYPDGENELFAFQVDGCAVTQEALDRDNGEAVGNYLEYVYSSEFVAEFVEETGLISLHEDATELADMPETTEAMANDIENADNRAEKIDLATYPEPSDIQYEESQRLSLGDDPEDIMAEIQAAVERAVENL